MSTVDFSDISDDELLHEDVEKTGRPDWIKNN